MGTTGKNFASVSFGFAAFLIAFSLGTALTAGTGIPLLGGLLNGVLVSMVLAVGMLAVNQFGTGTIMWLVLSVCAIPFTTLGPPGIYKVVIGVVAGLIWDCIYFGFKRSTLALYIGAIIAALSIMGILILALSLGFGRNAAEALNKYKGVLFAIVTINVFVTAFGVFWGHLIYTRRLSKLSIFKNLRGLTNGTTNEY